MLNSDIYHAVIHDARFSNDEDYFKFIGALLWLKNQGHCVCYAYTLIPGHAHLLFRVLDWDIERCMQALMDCCYGGGPVDYECEEICDAGHFIQVFRYIHQDAVREDLCGHPAEYSYSSWINDYLTDKADPICQTGPVIRRFGLEELHKAVNEMLPPDTDCIDFSPLE